MLFIFPDDPVGLMEEVHNPKQILLQDASRGYDLGFKIDMGCANMQATTPIQNSPYVVP